MEKAWWAMPSVVRRSSNDCCSACCRSDLFMRYIPFLLSLVFAAAPAVAAPAVAAPVEGMRIKALASIEGIRDNPLIGYGLVVGLNGTGDRQQTVFSVQSLTNMLREMGLT